MIYQNPMAAAERQQNIELQSLRAEVARLRARDDRRFSEQWPDAEQAIEWLHTRMYNNTGAGLFKEPRSAMEIVEFTAVLYSELNGIVHHLTAKR